MSRRNVPSDEDLLYCGALKWIPGNEGDYFRPDEVYYVTEDYYKQGRVRKGTSKEIGRWVCIVKHPKRYCYYCCKMGEHLTDMCPNKTDPANATCAGSLVGFPEFRNAKCLICLEEGHSIPGCPYSEYVPIGAKVVSDHSMVICRTCGNLYEHSESECTCETPDGEHVRIAGLKDCWVCGGWDHREDKCPVLLRRLADRAKNCTPLVENSPTEKVQTSLSKQRKGAEGKGPKGKGSKGKGSKIGGK